MITRRSIRSRSTSTPKSSGLGESIVRPGSFAKFQRGESWPRANPSSLGSESHVRAAKGATIDERAQSKDVALVPAQPDSVRGMEASFVFRHRVRQRHKQVLPKRPCPGFKVDPKKLMCEIVVRFIVDQAVSLLQGAFGSLS